MKNGQLHIADLNRNHHQASPDEEALVKAVKQLGFSFNVRTPQAVIINALGQEEKYVYFFGASGFHFRGGN